MTIRPGGLFAGALIALAALSAGPAAMAACGASESVRNDDPPPSTVSDDCGETGECEGSATTEPSGCDVPGVAVFDLDGRRICDGR